MPTPEDEKFECYLKAFRPLTPDPLPADGLVRAPQRWQALRLWGAVAAALLMIGIAGLLSSVRYLPQNHTARNPPLVGWFAPVPLTLRTANASLASAPSYKAAFDHLAFRSQSSKLPEGKQSAIAVLAKEKVKL